MRKDIPNIQQMSNLIIIYGGKNKYFYTFSNPKVSPTKIRRTVLNMKCTVVVIISYWNLKTDAWPFSLKKHSWYLMIWFISYGFYDNVQTHLFKKKYRWKSSIQWCLSLYCNILSMSNSKKGSSSINPRILPKNTFYTNVYQSYKDNRIGIFKYHYRYISPLLELFKLFFVYISEFLEERKMSNVIFRIKQQIRSSTLNIWTVKFLSLFFLETQQC